MFSTFGFVASLEKRVKQNPLYLVLSPAVGRVPVERGDDFEVAGLGVDVEGAGDEGVRAVLQVVLDLVGPVDVLVCGRQLYTRNHEDTNEIMMIMITMTNFRESQW
jgi:hypothetical protein